MILIVNSFDSERQLNIQTNQIMKISVALCTYNGERYLREQLESIAAQTRLPDEVVVCDDCSSDETTEIVREFVQTAPFSVRLFVNEENLKTVKNFEKAISLCAGDLIFLSDQDDVWLPDKLKIFEAEFADNKQLGLVFCDADLVDDNLHSLGLSSWQTLGFTVDKRDKYLTKSIDSSLLASNIVSGCMLAFRADYKHLILPMPVECEDVIHDYWIALLLLFASQVTIVPQRLVKYRQHSKQQIGAMNSRIEPTRVTNTAENKGFNRVMLSHKMHKLELVSERLLNSKLNAESQVVARQLQEYAKHLRAREALRTQTRAKMPTVLREVFSRRYHLYSNGFYSAARDLFL